MECLLWMPGKGISWALGQPTSVSPNGSPKTQHGFRHEAPLLPLAPQVTWAYGLFCGHR